MGVIVSNKICVIRSLQEIKTINDHKSNIDTLIILNDGRFASCSWDFTVKIFNTTTFDCDITLTGHNDAVTFLFQHPSNKLFTCSLDCSIKVWSIGETTFTLETTINNAHEEGIYKIINLSNNRMATCSKDQTVKIWSNNSPYNLLATLKGHTKWVSSILEIKDENLLVSGGWDATVRLWDLNFYQCNTIFDRVYCRNSNSMIYLGDNNVMIGGSDKITIIDTKKCVVLKKIKDDKFWGIYCFLLLKDRSVLCGYGVHGYGEFGKLFHLNLETYKGIFEKNKIHYNLITCIILIRDNLIATSSKDAKIKLFQMNTY